MESEALTFCGLAYATLAGIAWQNWNGWETKQPDGPDERKPMVDPRWDKLCDWLRDFPLFQQEPPRPHIWPIVLAIVEDPKMSDTFKVTLTFAGDVPQPGPDDPDKDQIVARRIRSEITPLAGGETVTEEHDHPLSDPFCEITGVPENSRVKVGACYVNDDGAASAEFTFLPEFDVVDTTGPVNLTEEVTVETTAEE